MCYCDMECAVIRTQQHAFSNQYASQQKKVPPAWADGTFNNRQLVLVKHFHYHAAVFLPAGGSFVIRDWLAFAKAFALKPAFINPLADEV